MICFHLQKQQEMFIHSYLLAFRKYASAKRCPKQNVNVQSILKLTRFYMTETIYSFMSCCYECNHHSLYNTVVYMQIGVEMSHSIHSQYHCHQNDALSVHLVLIINIFRRGCSKLCPEVAITLQINRSRQANFGT